MLKKTEIPNKKTVEKLMTDALNERGKWFLFGWRFIYARPLNYLQIADISAEVADMGGFDPQAENGGFKMALALKYGENATQLNNIALIALYRNQLKREKMRDYISARMTQGKMAKILELFISGLDADFFLQTIIFLRGTHHQTKPTKTIVHTQ